MEIVLIAVVIVVIGALIFLNNKKPEVKQPEAPYKVEAPVVEEASQPAVKAEEAPAKKARKPRAAKAEVKKPAAKKTVAKKATTKKSKKA